MVPSHYCYCLYCQREPQTYLHMNYVNLLLYTFNVTSYQIHVLEDPLTAPVGVVGNLASYVTLCSPLCYLT